MLSFAGSLKIFIALEPCDMRAGARSLHALIAERLKEQVGSGVLFVFTSRRRQQLSFNIPIRHCNHRIPVASATWKAITCSPSPGTEGHRVD
jgi:transposase